MLQLQETEHNQDRSWGDPRT